MKRIFVIRTLSPHAVKKNGVNLLAQNIFEKSAAQERDTICILIRRNNLLFDNFDATTNFIMCN